MRTIIAFSLLLTLTANKCRNDGAGGTAAFPLDRKWSVQTLDGKALTLPEGVERPWLKLSDGNIEGFGGCNQLMGGYALEGSKLTFSNVGSTKMYCEAVQATEDAITNMLGRVDGYKLDGNTLKLLGGGKELATLKGE